MAWGIAVLGTLVLLAVVGVSCLIMLTFLLDFGLFVLRFGWVGL